MNFGTRRKVEIVPARVMGRNCDGEDRFAIARASPLGKHKDVVLPPRLAPVLSGKSAPPAARSAQSAVDGLAHGLALQWRVVVGVVAIVGA